MKMKKAYIEGICCDGCARDIQHILSNIYGVSNVSVNVEENYVLFDGFVSKELIQDTLAEEGYKLLSIEKVD